MTRSKELLPADESTRNETADRIVGAALRALARYGPRQLSVSDVCAEAQIARATFYRYFTDKQEVLDSVAGHYVREVARRIALAIEADPRPSARVEIVLLALTGFRHADADLGTMMQVAPGYTLQFLETTFPELIAVLTVALEPAFQNGLRDTTAAMTPEQLAELVLRLLVSMLLLPGSDAAEIPSVITSLWPVVALS